MTVLKRLLIIFTVLGVQTAFADQVVIRLSTFPTMTVADARSTVTVTAQVYKTNGEAAPDGTQVIFTTNLGSFRQPIVQTSGGRARGILVSGGIPGTATITASCPGAAPSSLEIEFLSDRNLLSNAKEYIELVAPGYMMYSVEQKLIAAAGPSKGARLRYRDIEIEADDLQMNVPAYDVRAKKARLHMGKVVQEFDELYIRLNTHRGYGWTTFSSPVITGIHGQGRGFAIDTEERKHYGLAEITSTGLRNPTKPPLDDQFTFEDIVDSASMIGAKKAVIFPRKEVQFQKAEVMVGGVTVMKLPLYELNLVTSSPIVTDSILNVNDNQLEVNYPYYLSLKPGETSLLRFHTGQRYGRSVSGSRGMFLDYELNWNRGDEMEGGLTLGNLARKDWSIGAHQYMRIDKDTTASGFFEVPAGKAVFGSADIRRQFKGFQASLFANSNQSLRGTRYNSQQMSFVAETNPLRLGKVPAKFYFGLNADQQATSSPTTVRSQSSYGAHLRSELNPIRLDRSSTLMASATVSRLEGKNVNKGLTFLGNASLARQFGKNAVMYLTYEFTQDPYTSSLLGKHHLSMTASYNSGPFEFNFSGSRGLDVNRMSYFIDSSYQLSSLWKLRYSYTFDKYFTDSFLDYNVSISYLIGLREVGLTWSQRTKRIGIQLFGAGIN